MKRSKRLLILFAALVAVSGAAAAAVYLLPDEELESYSAISLFSFEPEEASALSYTYDGETVELVNDGGAWEYAGDSAFPLDDDYVDSMLAALGGLTATQEITAPEDTAQYGLDEPELTIGLTLDADYTITVGSETEMGGERYLSTGDGNVYLVDAAIVDPFSHSLYDLIECESIPNMNDTVSFTVESGTYSYTIDHITEDAPEYTDYYEYFLATDDGYMTLSSTAARVVVGGITNLSWTRCVCYDAGSDELASYGLDEPSAVATVEYVYTEEDSDGEETEYQASFTLELGDYCDDGVYARIAGSKMVYVVSADTLDNILNLDPETDMLPTEPVRLTLEDVTGFDMTADGETYSVSIERSTVYDDDGNASEEVAYTLSDGTELDSGALTGALDDLNSMYGDGDGTDRGGSEIASFTFYQDRKGYERVTLSFTAYDSTDCLTTLNGQTRVLAPLSTVNDAVNAILDAIAEAAGEMEG